MDGETHINTALSLGDSISDAPVVRVVIITMDARLGVVTANAEAALRKKIPNLSIKLHSAATWEHNAQAAEQAIRDIANADIIVSALLFLDYQIAPILSALQARSKSCDAFVGCMATPDVVKLTRLGKFSMDKPASGPIALLKRLRGSGNDKKAGASQAKMLRRLPKILKYIPGTAQDVRSYFLTMQYWLAGSQQNIENMIAFLIDRYADGERAIYRDALAPGEPIEYPETGLYHPRMAPKVSADPEHLPSPVFSESPPRAADGDAHISPRDKKSVPAVGLLIMRSYVLSGDADHYDGVIAAIESRGLRVIPAFASGLDARPAIEKYFIENGTPFVDAVVSLTGFSLVGGPAYNDASAAENVLRDLDIPYIAAQALEFQSLDEWKQGTRGLTPVETTMMVALPELDGATGPIVFGGRTNGDGLRMQCCKERAEMLAARVDTLVNLRRKARGQRKVAIVLYNFPPNSGATGTAAFLSVFESLFNTLNAMANAGYDVTPPESVEALRMAILGTGPVDGAADHDAFKDANVAAKVSTDTHVKREERLSEIEAEWGPAPGRHQTDGRSIDILGATFGNIFVGVQPSFGYEGDPMRLLFQGGLAPTHAFAAFYGHIKETFNADAVLHFGTHGALEFMPGKQCGPSGDCWPDYLIGALPNLYFYAANNPSEAAIAKRRSAATTISYLTPAVTRADLYKGLADLKSSIERFRSSSPDEQTAREDLTKLIQAQAAGLDLAAASPEWTQVEIEPSVEALSTKLFEYEQTLIPHGLHIAGQAISEAERRDLLQASLPAEMNNADGHALVDAVIKGASTKTLIRMLAQPASEEITATVEQLKKLNNGLQTETEIPALLAALDGRYIPPVPGGDVLRNPDILPTGRNIHGFDPFRMPTAYAVKDGARQADRLLNRCSDDATAMPETVAIVLWGTDNLKSEGAQIAQALALMGAKPRYDHFGRLAGAELISLKELARPRVDVIVTLSGIFRDLLPMQTRMLAEAAYAAASANEPLEKNFVRKHALAYQHAHNCDLKTAALRVFSNADGAYGANVNQLVDASAFMDDAELGDAYKKRKCFAYGLNGAPVEQAELLDSILSDVDVAYQNLESVELGVTTIDHYFDTLGGISRAIKNAKGKDAPVYIGDQTQSDGLVRTLNEQVALETRTRTLNPKWYEGMLNHGYEGVRQIEAQVTNTMGWSATTAAVAPWVYQEISETFVLDDELRERLATLNPKSCARVANRLIEASERNYWSPDEETLDALRRAGEELEDRLEGIYPPSEGAVA
ncbi:MAG: magnesium chelatase subunit H [Pseudomonadota bacterium]